MKQILATEFTQQDLVWLAALDKTDFQRTSASELFEKVISGERLAWRVEKEKPLGIFLTFVDDAGVFWVDGMAGEGLRTHAAEIAEEIKALADGRVIRCIVSSPVLFALYTKKLGFTALGTILELENVR